MNLEGSKMDEVTFRRRIYTNPNDSDKDICEACQQDTNKAKFKKDLQQFDQSLISALNVDVPENLADRILLSQSIDFQKAQKRKNRVHLAIAASIAFTIGITFQMFGLSPRHDTYAQHAIAHVEAESQHLHEDDVYSTSQLNAKLAHYGGEVLTELAPITFASFCRFGGIKSLHIVLQGETHPVTVFILPKQSGLQNTGPFKSEDYQGNTIQLKNADMLIVTDKNDSPLQWQQKLNKAIKWQQV